MASTGGRPSLQDYQTATIPRPTLTQIPLSRLPPDWICLHRSRRRSRHTLKLELSYDRRPVGQSLLVSGHHLGLTNNFSISLKLTSDICVFLLAWGALFDERMGLYFIRTSATGPCQSCHSLVQVPENLRPDLNVSLQLVTASLVRYVFPHKHCSVNLITKKCRSSFLPLTRLPLNGRYLRNYCPAVAVPIVSCVVIVA
jgi:hypothetical protein